MISDVYFKSSFLSKFIFLGFLVGSVASFITGDLRAGLLSAIILVLFVMLEVQAQIIDELVRLVYDDE